MIKKYSLIIIIYLFFSLNLNAGGLITFNWYWGMESINNNQYFVIDLKPELKYRSFSLKLDLPVEINSNREIYNNHWDTKYDIITKIDHFTYTNSIFYIKIKTLNNIIMGNGELIYEYSNDLFYPLLIKKGMHNSLTIGPFNTMMIIDDLNDNDLFFLDLWFTYKDFKTGTVFAYDHDIFDPYTEKPIDKNMEISSMNFYANYEILKKGKVNLIFQNDIIKHLKSFSSAGEKMTFASGFNIKYLPAIDFTAKGKYYQNNVPKRIVFNKFYEIERGVTNNRIMNKDLFGISGRLDLYYKKYLNLSFYIDKVDRSYPTTSIILKNLEDFPTKIRFSIELYNRINEKWYQMIGERERNSFVLLKNSVPLSGQLSLNFDYLKSFEYDNNNLKGLRQALLYLEFLF